MKSYNTSISPLRRALIAAAVVLTTGSGVALAQNQGTSDQNAGPNYNNSTSTPSTANDNMSNMNTSDNPSSATANENTAATSDNGSKLDRSDRHFLTKTAKGNQDEIQIAQLATQRASSPDVRNFAQQMLDAHTKLQSDLQSLAQNKNVTLDTNANKESHEYKKLSKASGDDFDREFVKTMVSAHKKDIKEFKDRADDSKDSDVKSFAQNTLPTLQQHLQMAQQLEQSIVPTGRSGRESWKGSSDTNANPSAGANTNPSAGATSSTSSSANTASTSNP